MLHSGPKTTCQSDFESDNDEGAWLSYLYPLVLRGNDVGIVSDHVIREQKMVDCRTRDVWEEKLKPKAWATLLHGLYTNLCSKRRKYAIGSQGYTLPVRRSKREGMSWFRVRCFEFVYRLTVRVSFPAPRIMCPCYTWSWLCSLYTRTALYFVQPCIPSMSSPLCHI